jgi:hypothetical protein
MAEACWYAVEGVGSTFKLQCNALANGRSSSPPTIAAIPLFVPRIGEALLSSSVLHAPPTLAPLS